MILKFLGKLATGKRSGNDAANNPEAVTYKGYTISPMPKQGGGQWTTEGYISKDIGGVSKSEHFIRVESHIARDEATKHSIFKAKQIIDEQGDKLFKDK